MKIEFEMPTPNACIECQFHTLVTDGRYGPWVLKCLLNSDIKTAVKEGLKKRNDNCPGRIENEDNNDSIHL